MKENDQNIILNDMSDDLMLCMWRQMLMSKDKQPHDIQTQTLLRNELLRRGVIKPTADPTKFAIVNK